MNNEIYKLTIKTPEGSQIKMSEFKDNVLLIVNTATRCGLAHQFEDIEFLHRKYKDKGLVVLGFPSGQFLNQEPETNETMTESCKTNFGVTFQLTEKINVNGNKAHPVFKFLKKRLAGNFGNHIKWNFTKFLVSADGKPYKRYGPLTKPSEIEGDIQQLLSAITYELQPA